MFEAISPFDLAELSLLGFLKILFIQHSGWHPEKASMNIYSPVLLNMQEDAMKRLNDMIGGQKESGKEDEDDDENQEGGALVRV